MDPIGRVLVQHTSIPALGKVFQGRGKKKKDLGLSSYAGFPSLC